MLKNTIKYTFSYARLSKNSVLLSKYYKIALSVNSINVYLCKIMYYRTDEKEITTETASKSFTKTGTKGVLFTQRKGVQYDAAIFGETQNWKSITLDS